jgi:hypothetical protein
MAFIGKARVPHPRPIVVFAARGLSGAPSPAEWDA